MAKKYLEIFEFKFTSPFNEPLLKGEQVLFARGE